MLDARQIETLIARGFALAACTLAFLGVLGAASLLAQEENSRVAAAEERAAREARGGGAVTSTEMLGDLLRRIEQGEVANLTDVSALIRSGDLLEGAVTADESASAIGADRRPPGRPAPGGPRTLPARPSADSRGLPNRFAPKAINAPQPLYSNLGWTGASASAGTGAGASRQKIMELVETATSNRFEVDFNRLQPGTIITNLNYTITEPGFYYLIGDLTNTQVNRDGIIIDTDNVTIDLMGYNLVGGIFSGINSDDGIVVQGTQSNIRIRNGGIRGWNGDGINALSARSSTFSDIHARSNGGDGVVGDLNNLMVRINAYSNGFDGIEADDASVFLHCTAGQNGDNGIQMSAHSVAVNCASFDNGTDGFDMFTSSVVDSCVATDNAIYGFDMALGSAIVNSSAYDNLSNGFDMASACILRSCIAGLNSGHGVRTFANSWVIDSVFHENDLDGIRISSTDCQVRGNHVTDNDNGGIVVTSSGNLIIQNTMTGNVTNFLITGSSTFGPFVNVEADDDISGVTDADHPWANLIF